MEMDHVQPGQQLGPYRIVSQIGRGGMATVYKAYHAAMDRYVAVKVLPGEFAKSAEFMGRFRQEARTIANLEHSHILPVHDYGESDGITYFVMRLLETGTLKERITSGPLALAEIDELFSQVADALGYAHQHGVIHRDIKPSNILIDKNGDTFLTDFGIAKILEEGSPQFTSTGAITGTPAYMSPEQAQGEKLDPRSDIYALGIVLYEMITGRVPFEAETPLAVILKHLQAPLPLPSEVKPDIHPEVERVLLKALAKDRNDRFESCKEFLAAWKAAVKAASNYTQPVKAGTTASVPAPPASSTYPRTPISEPSQSSAAVWILGGLAALALICLCLFATVGAGAAIPLFGLGVSATPSPPLDDVPPRDPTPSPVATATLPPVEIIPTDIPLPTAAPGLAEEILSFGGQGNGPGFFEDARYLAVDGDGNIYLGEHTEGSRVQVFDPNGKFVTQWKVDEDSLLTGLAADRSGVVYAMQGWSIFRYEGATGKLLGQLNYDDIPESMVVTVEDELVVVSDDAIVRFNGDGRVVMRTTEPLSEMIDESLSVANIAVDGEGNIYIVSTFLYSVFKFSADGKFMDRFGSEGDGPGQFSGSLEAVAVDGQGRIYVSDFDGIKVFSPEGEYLETIRVEGIVFDMLFTTANELIAVDRNAYKAVKYRVKP